MDFLTTTIADVAGTNTKGKVFADLFAGTGVVGKTFKEQGYRVISNDIQYYSYVLNKHLIENVPPLSVDIVDSLNQLTGTEGFIYKNYCAGSGSGVRSIACMYLQRIELVFCHVCLFFVIL